VIDVNLAVQAVTAVAVAITAYYGYRNNQIAHATSAKVDAVQVTQDGVGHALAKSLEDNQQQNQDLIRNLAAAGLAPPVKDPP
jgi:hypothetical protein